VSNHPYEYYIADISINTFLAGESLHAEHLNIYQFTLTVRHHVDTIFKKKKITLFIGYNILKFGKIKIPKLKINFKNFQK